MNRSDNAHWRAREVKSHERRVAITPVGVGAGVSGQNAANIALGIGADVTLLDTDLDKLRMSFWRHNNRVRGLASSTLAIQQAVMEATW